MSSSTRRGGRRRLGAAEAIREILRQLTEVSPYIRAAAVVRVSGLTVEALMPPTIDAERVAAMAAVMLLLGERITLAMQNGDLDKVYIKGREGHIILMAIGQKAVLTVMASERASLGLLFVEMQQTAAKLQRFDFS